MAKDPSELRELRELGEHWRGFAREAPFQYARVGSDGGDRASFYAAGDRDVGAVLDFCGRDVARGRALDLGCGPGRHLAALAREFQVVDGADIAPEMLDVARSSGLPPAVTLTHTTGAELRFPDATFDFVMSLLVFQHIPDDRIVLANLREIRRVMKADARAVVQFDSRPQTLPVRLVQSLPDALLPGTRRRYMRRYRRDPTVIDRLLREAGLSVARESGRESATHFIAATAEARKG